VVIGETGALALAGGEVKGGATPSESGGVADLVAASVVVVGEVGRLIGMLLSRTMSLRRNWRVGRWNRTGRRMLEAMGGNGLSLACCE
jgi:hypothetical protein